MNYARTNITVGTSITAPDGTATGGNISATTTATTQFRTGTITISATSVTASVFVKKQSLDTIAMRLYDTTAVAYVLETEYTFSTNTTTVTSGTGTLTATNVGNGWIRLALTNTAWTSGNGLRFFIHFTNVSANAGDSLYVWGVQVEAQSFASSCIPTTTATVARGRDSAQMLGTNFSDWYNQNEGTFLANWKQALPGVNEFGIAFRASTSTGLPNSMWIGKQLSASAGQRIEYEIRGSGTQRLGSGVNVTAPFISASGAYKVGDTFGLAYNGNSITSVAYTQTPAPDRLHIGSFDQTSATGPINSTISRIAYWPTRLPDETIQALTT